MISLKSNDQTGRFLSLGVLYDADKGRTGGQIFKFNRTDEVEKCQSYKFSLKSISEMKDCQQVLGISSAVSLKVKAGLFDAGAAGNYLKQRKIQEDCYEVLVRATIETVSATFLCTLYNKISLNWAS